MADQGQAAAHRDAAYAQGDDTRSWFEKHPDVGGGGLTGNRARLVHRLMAGALGTLCLHAALK
jgi:hypothetical protein